MYCYRLLLLVSFRRLRELSQSTHKQNNSRTRHAARCHWRPRSFSSPLRNHDASVYSFGIPLPFLDCETCSTYTPHASSLGTPVQNTKRKRHRACSGKTQKLPAVAHTYLFQLPLPEVPLVLLVLLLCVHARLLIAGGGGGEGSTSKRNICRVFKRGV